MMWGTNKSSANHLVCRQVIGFSYHSCDHKISGYTWHVRVKNSSYNCHVQRTVQKFLIIYNDNLWYRDLWWIFLADRGTKQLGHLQRQIYPEWTITTPIKIWALKKLTLTQIHFRVPMVMHTPNRNTAIRAILCGALLNTHTKNLRKCLEIASSKRHSPGTNCANANGKWPQHWSHFP